VIIVVMVVSVDDRCYSLFQVCSNVRAR